MTTNTDAVPTAAFEKWASEEGINNFHFNHCWDAWQAALSQRSVNVSGVPTDVMAALDRMCTPLDESVLKGATAEADAHSMKLIRDYVLAAPPAVPVQSVPVAWMYRKPNWVNWHYKEWTSDSFGEDADEYMRIALYAAPQPAQTAQSEPSLNAQHRGELLVIADDLDTEGASSLAKSLRHLVARDGAKSEGSPTDWHDVCATLIDIYDDGMNNAPEDRCYVEGAWKEELDKTRVLLASAQPDAEQKP